MTLIELTSLLEASKLVVIEGSGLGKDALHIYFGMALFVAVRLVWRWRGGWLAAWLVVLAMACGGEWLDMSAEANRSAIQPDAAHWHDIWNTMFWPTILLLVGRWLQPNIMSPPGAPDQISGENAERRLEQA